MNLHDTPALRRLVELSHVRRANGSDHTVHPKLVDAIFGAGDALIGLTPTAASSPNYYVVRVDGGWDLNAENGLRAHLDEIKDAIAAQFGEMTDADGEAPDWPVADFTVGCTWFRYLLQEAMTEYVTRAVSASIERDIGAARLTRERVTRLVADVLAKGHILPGIELRDVKVDGTRWTFAVSIPEWMLADPRIAALVASGAWKRLPPADPEAR